MKVALTDATGFIGSHMLTELHEHGREVTAVAVGAPGSDDEARACLSDYFAEILLLDQGTAAARVRAELGWYPSHPSLADKFRHGSYRK
jgi:nucleoside-diphosphate-sugar epimerase